MQEMALPLKVTALPAAGRARASVAHQLLSRRPPLALTLRPATARLLLRLRRRTRIPPQHSIANCSTLGPDHSQGNLLLYQSMKLGLQNRPLHMNPAVPVRARSERKISPH